MFCSVPCLKLNCGHLLCLRTLISKHLIIKPKPKASICPPDQTHQLVNLQVGFRKSIMTTIYLFLLGLYSENQKNKRKLEARSFFSPIWPPWKTIRPTYTLMKTSNIPPAPISSVLASQHWLPTSFSRFLRHTFYLFKSHLKNSSTLW